MMKRMPFAAGVAAAALLVVTTATAAFSGEKRSISVHVCPTHDWELIAELQAKPEIAVEFVCQFTINGSRRTLPVPIP